MKKAIGNSGLVFMCSALLATPLWAQTDLTSSEQKAGYSIGANIGYNLASQGVDQDIDVDSLIAGVRDGISGELQMTDQEIVAVLQEFSAIQQAKAEAEVLASQQDGANFLIENGSKEGVVTTASGLQYMVMSKTSDSSAARPDSSSTVEVHYHGTMIDGSVFDSSVDRGESISFAVTGVIPGWTEGLQLMQVGDKYKFFIPPELGYGANAIGQLPPNSVLIFEVELLGIQ